LGHPVDWLQLLNSDGCVMVALTVRPYNRVTVVVLDALMR